MDEIDKAILKNSNNILNRHGFTVTGGFNIIKTETGEIKHKDLTAKELNMWLKGFGTGVSKGIPYGYRMNNTLSEDKKYESSSSRKS